MTTPERERCCCYCDGEIVGPDNIGSHANRQRCVDALRARCLAAEERARNLAYNYGNELSAREESDALNTQLLERCLAEEQRRKEAEARAEAEREYAVAVVADLETARRQDTTRCADLNVVRASLAAERKRREAAERLTIVLDRYAFLPHEPVIRAEYSEARSAWLAAGSRLPGEGE